MRNKLLCSIVALSTSSFAASQAFADYGKEKMDGEHKGMMREHHDDKHKEKMKKKREEHREKMKKKREERREKREEHREEMKHKHHDKEHKDKHKHEDKGHEY